MAEEESKYKCTQSELYSITGLAITNLDEDLDDFHNKKTKYDDAFVLAMKDQRTAAMALPDEESRNAVHQTLKNKLPDLKDVCRDNFSDLKGYIRDGWPNEEPKPRYEAAGLNFDSKIGTNNWENVVSLNEKMNQFIAGNETLLGTPGGMPNTFKAKVLSDTTKFNDVYNPYKTARQTEEATGAKLKANNNLYDACMDFMEDGTTMVYKRNDDKKKRYIFSELKNIVSPPGSTSMTVRVKKTDDNVWGNVTVKIKAEGRPQLTGQTDVAEGAARFDNIDPADYDGEIITPNGTTTFKKTAETGTRARITVVAT